MLSFADKYLDSIKLQEGECSSMVRDGSAYLVRDHALHETRVHFSRSEALRDMEEIYQRRHFR